MPDFTADMTLSEAQAKLRTLIDDGVRCPCCTQFTKVYRRTIHSTMARELITFYRQAGQDWLYLPGSVMARGGDTVKCRYWGLIEEDNAVRDDGSSRTGWWRVTPFGAAWIEDRTVVIRYARVYDGRCLGLVGEPFGIRDALGKKFDYRELMGA